MKRGSWIAQSLVAEASRVGTKKKGAKSYSHVRGSRKHNTKDVKFKNHFFCVQTVMDVNTDNRDLPNGRETPINGDISDVIHKELHETSKENSSKCIIYLEIIGFLSTITVLVALAVFHNSKETLQFEFPFRRTNNCLAIFITMEVVLTLVGLTCICDFARRMGWMNSMSSRRGKVKNGMKQWKFCSDKFSLNCIASFLEIAGFLSLIGTAVVLAVLYHNKHTISFEFPFRRTNRRFALFVAIELLLAIAGLGCVFGFLRRIRSNKFVPERTGSVEVAKTTVNRKYESSNGWEEADTQTRSGLWET